MSRAGAGRARAPGTTASAPADARASAAPPGGPTTSQVLSDTPTYPLDPSNGSS